MYECHLDYQEMHMYKIIVCTKTYKLIKIFISKYSRTVSIKTKLFNFY